MLARFIIMSCLAMYVTNGHCFAQVHEVEYVSDIKPILKSKCYSCHGAIKQEGGLRLDTVAFMKTGGDSGPAIATDDLPRNLLLHRIQADGEERMPPEGEPVSPEQIQRITLWLNNGAKAPENEQPQTNPDTHWAFQPLMEQVSLGGAHPVDAFIDRRLSDAGLHRSIPAAATALVRRMFFDLHGLPPSPDQIDKWRTKLNADSRESAVPALIDDLLKSPRYGERWAQHWLDVVRYADTHGYEVNTPRPNAWPYRDYVIRAFNEDRPYDRFVFEQLAGDTVGEDAATGFMVAAAALLPGQIGKDEESKRLARQDELDEIIVGTTATFLGMTVGCARCHDHKFDPIPQTDYYAMQAFFAGVDYGDREIRRSNSDEHEATIRNLQATVDTARRQLDEFTPTAFGGRTIVIDDEDLDQVTSLSAKNGHGTNPAGTGRGYRDDVGDRERMGNLSRSRYTWWDNHPGEDVFTWNLSAEGHFRLWISWGVHGSGVHTRDARYVLDFDGDLKTKDDQREIAQADQYYFAGQNEGDSEKKPLWSGLLDTGTHELTASTKLILRGGETGTGITADVVVLQEVNPSNVGTADKKSNLPHLRAPVSPLKNVERFPATKARFVRFTTFATNENNRYQPCIDELEIFSSDDSLRNVALAEYGTKPTSSGNYSETGKHQLKHINDGRYGNSYSWISNERGMGWVQLEFQKPETINRIEWARDRDGKFKDRLPIRYEITSSADGVTWTTLATSGDRKLEGVPHNDVNSLLRYAGDVNGVDVAALATKLTKTEKQLADLRKPQMAFAGRFREPSTTFVLNRGDPEQPTVEITPRALSQISSLKLPNDSSDEQRRIALAQWIASPENPLTARVIANRVWQYHFGIGLVATPSDFGLNGARPSHPKLLDWLASELINSGWSIKHLHRLIMTSETYQQSARSEQRLSTEQSQQQIDANNRLLWRFPSRRLEAEAIRDSILSVSGQLNLETGGPGFNFFKSRGGLSGFPPVEDFTTNELRRMIYSHKIRMERVPVFGAFDCPDAGLPTPRRCQSTTAIQALNLFNSPFVIEQANRLAERITRDHPESVDLQISRAFELAVGRHPTASETSAVGEVVRVHGLPTLCRALFNSNEFLFIP